MLQILEGNKSTSNAIRKKFDNIICGFYTLGHTAYFRQTKMNENWVPTFLSFLSSLVSTRVGGGVSFGSWK